MCLAQEHNTMTLPGLEHGPLGPESNALTITLGYQELQHYTFFTYIFKTVVKNIGLEIYYKMQAGYHLKHINIIIEN